jgi:hypothetical protein
LAEDRLIRFDNLRTEDVQVNVEPWAMSFTVPPDADLQVEFEPSGDHQDEVAALADGSITLGVYANRLVVRLNKEVVWRFPPL